MKAELEKMGFIVGAKVRQYHSVTQYADAEILCVHDNGALDVEIDGKKFGWTADRCVPVRVLEANTAKIVDEVINGTSDLEPKGLI